MNPLVSHLSTQDTDAQDEINITFGSFGEETGDALGCVDADDVIMADAVTGGCSRGGDIAVTFGSFDEESDCTGDVGVAVDGGEDGARADAASEASPGAGGSTFAPVEGIEIVRPRTARNRSGRLVAGRRRARSTGRHRGRGGRRRRKGRGGRAYLKRGAGWNGKASRKRGRRRALQVSRAGGLGLAFVRGGANPGDIQVRWFVSFSGTERQKTKMSGHWKSICFPC